MRFYFVIASTVLGLFSCKMKTESQSEVLGAKGSTTQVSCSGNNSSSFTARLPKDKDPTMVKSITLNTIKADDGISAWLNQVGTKTTDPTRMPKSVEWKNALVFELPDYEGISGLTKRTVMIQPQLFLGKSSGQRLDARYVTQVDSEKEKNYLMKCDVEN